MRAPPLTEDSLLRDEIPALTNILNLAGCNNGNQKKSLSRGHD
jgi:hypothetical protein